MENAQHDHAEVKIPPPVLTLIHVLAAFGLNWLIPLRASTPIWRFAGVALVFTGLALAFLAVRQLIMAHTTIEPHGTVSALVTEGPYRFSRNPIYLSFVLILIGLPLALWTFWGAVLSPLLIGSLDQLVIRYEESYLGNKFAKQYSAYKSRVRRWL